MGLLGELFEAAMSFAGILGVLALIVAILIGLGFLVVFSVLCVGLPIEIFTHDQRGKLIPWRVALVIGVTVGLFLIRWYLPFAIAGTVGLVGMFIELIGTSW